MVRDESGDDRKHVTVRLGHGLGCLGALAVRALADVVVEEVDGAIDRRADRLVVRDGETELYDLSADGAEQNDISSTEPRRTYEMEQALRGWMMQHGQNPQDYRGMEQDPIEIF